MDPFLDEPQSSGPGFDPMLIVRAFFRRKWLFIIPFILCFSMAAVAIKIMTPVYFSAGQVRIIFNSTDTRLINDPSRRYGQPRNIDRQAFQEMDMLLTSPDFLEKVVRNLNLHLTLRQKMVQAGHEPVSEEEAVLLAIQRLKAMIRIKQDGAHLFLIGIRDPNPDQAFHLITNILEEFLQEYRANQVAFRTSTRDFLEKQLEGYRLTLATAERELTEFQTNMASVSLLDNSVNARNLGNAERNLGQMRDRQRGSDRTEMARLQQEALAVLNPLPPLNRFQSDPSISSVVREMVDLALAQSVYSKTERGAEEYEEDLAQLRVRLNMLVETKVTADYPNLGFMDRNRLSQYVYFGVFQAGLKQVADKLEGWIKEFRSFAAQQPVQSARLLELQDAVVQANELVRTLNNEIIQQNLNLEASQSEIGFQIKVRQNPAVPQGPIEPNKKKLMLMGFLLSIALGTGLVVLAILLDRSFTSVSDIERTLGLTVIGTLPVIQDDIFERKRKLRILRWVTIVLGIIAVGAVGFLVIYPRLT
jgi:capsular polysaccharide biosynthesis protein